MNRLIAASSARTRWKWPALPRHRILVSASAILLVALVVFELQSSWLASHLWAAIAGQVSFSTEKATNDPIPYPGSGPYDQRLGYTRFQGILNRVKAQGFTLQKETYGSRAYVLLAKLRIYPAYPEKVQAGLQLLDRDGNPFYAAKFPRRAYENFSEIPPIVVRTVLFIENRDLLDSEHPYRNPAVTWSRLSRAVVDFGLHAFNRKRPVIGGSTLATQLEKMRHSPGGRTPTVSEKIRQITAASLRVYRSGPQTLSEQRKIVRDYVNSIPLAATPAEGEVNGLGDGLWAWYGMDFSGINSLLSDRGELLNENHERQRARGYRAVLSLFIATRAPSQYLVRTPEALRLQTDGYLRALCRAGIISTRLRDFALNERLRLRSGLGDHPHSTVAAGKAAMEARISLLSLLDLESTYALDRLDLTATTTLDNTAQQQVSTFLESLKDRTQVTKAGLVQEKLLSEGDPRSVIYSFILYERGQGMNLLRVQTDNYAGPLNINLGTKLQLGSTAKLRTLINYLQIVEELHRQYSGMSSSELSSIQVVPDDHLTAWAISYLSETKDRSLVPMLEAALNRKYSGNPYEGFFTTGGLQYFANFETEENSWIATVGQAFEQSVNLVFIRLMRDIENYYLWRLPGISLTVLSSPDDPQRSRYLARFADEEGTLFLRRFYQRYSGLTPQQALENLAKAHPTERALAAIYRSVCPQADLSQFSDFIKTHRLASAVAKDDFENLYDEYDPSKFSLMDRGYLAHVHPLELWLLNYRYRRPNADFSEILANSSSQRQEVYQWLRRSRYKNAQDHRIRTVLEEDAFKDIWKGWRREGYPFDSLVPSYATSIGVSGDTPAALADLMGIIANGGVRYPSTAFRELRMAEGTPVEAILDQQPGAGERVLSPEITRLVRQELVDVVERGTARRAQGGIALGNGVIIPLGGKTGTGDNRFKVFGPGGAPISSRAVNRTAAFAFLIGDRFFGTVLAFVPGKSAERYEFTSALAVQIFKDLEPVIKPFIASSLRDNTSDHSVILARTQSAE